MLGGRDPVGVDRAPGRSASPCQRIRKRSAIEPARSTSRCGTGRPAPEPARHERERGHRRAGEVVTRLLVGDVDQRPQAELRAEQRERRLYVDPRVGGGRRARAARPAAGPARSARPSTAAPRARTARAHEFLDVDPGSAARPPSQVGSAMRVSNATTPSSPVISSSLKRRAFAWLPQNAIEHQRRRAAGGAVVEARRAGVRPADAHTRALGVDPEHARASKATMPSARRGESARGRSDSTGRPPASVSSAGCVPASEPVVDQSDRHRIGRPALDGGAHAGVDRLAELARLEQHRGGRLHRLQEQPRATGSDLLDGEQALDVAARSRRVLTKSSAGRPPSQYQYGTPNSGGPSGRSRCITGSYRSNWLQVASNVHSPIHSVGCRRRMSAEDLMLKPVQELAAHVRGVRSAPRWSPPRWLGSTTSMSASTRSWRSTPSGRSRPRRRSSPATSGRSRASRSRSNRTCRSPGCA